MAKETQKAQIEKLEKELWEQKVLVGKFQKEIYDMQDVAEESFLNSPTYIQQIKLIKQQEAEIKALKGQVEHERKLKDNFQKQRHEEEIKEQYDVDSFEFWEETRKLSENAIKKLKKEFEFYDKEEDKLSKLLDELKDSKARIFMLEAQNKELAKKVARGGRKQKFTEQDKALIKMYRLQGKTIKELAEIFDCSVGLIHKLVNE